MIGQRVRSGAVLFDAAQASLDRAAFSDPAIHALELRRVFAPSWLFAGPANLVARPGDWLATRLGREPVILWRDPAGTLKAFINLCPRCERALGEGEQGSAERLACPSHPHDADLTRVAQLAVHRGLVFASLDPAALAFLDWLAPFAAQFDGAFGGTMEAAGGHRLSWRFAGNWKLAMERFCGDLDGGRSAHAATDCDRAVARVWPGRPSRCFPTCLSRLARRACKSGIRSRRIARRSTPGAWSRSTRRRRSATPPAAPRNSPGDRLAC